MFLLANECLTAVLVHFSEVLCKAQKYITIIVVVQYYLKRDELSDYDNSGKKSVIR